MLDSSLEVLQTIDREFSSRVNTLVSYPFNLRKVCTFADVFVGAVLVPGAPSPVVVTREMVQLLHSHSIVIDCSIDQGGCIETSRPTNHSNPTYLEEDVIHYCVPNMTGVLGRTATHAMSNATWPFIKQIAEIGVEKSSKITQPFKAESTQLREKSSIKLIKTPWRAGKNYELQDQYRQKVRTPAEAVKAVKSGDRIFLTGNCSVPSQILAALVDRPRN